VLLNFFVAYLYRLPSLNKNFLFSQGTTLKLAQSASQEASYFPNTTQPNERGNHLPFEGIMCFNKAKIRKGCGSFLFRIHRWIQENDTVYLAHAQGMRREVKAHECAQICTNILYLNTCLSDMLQHGKHLVHVGQHCKSKGLLLSNPLKKTQPQAVSHAQLELVQRVRLSWPQLQCARVYLPVGLLGLLLPHLRSCPSSSF